MAPAPRPGEVGGEATPWEARPGTAAEEGELLGTFRAAREEAYTVSIARAERVRRKAQMGGGVALPGRPGKLERAFRAERRRDYLRLTIGAEAQDALRAARPAVREGWKDEGTRVAEGGR